MIIFTENVSSYLKNRMIGIYKYMCDFELH